MSHYLVTGGLGVVGSLYAMRKAAQGHFVTVVDDGRDPRHEWTARQLKGLGREVRVIREDIRYWNQFPLCDFVLHAAASTGIPYSAQQPADDWSRNVETTDRLMNWLREVSKPPRTVVLSSVKPCSTRRMPLTERSPLDPDEPYAASKGAQSMLAQAFARTYDLPVWVLRCSNLFGPAPCHGPRHGWLTWFCIQTALGWPITIQGSGEQSRDMLYTDDLFDAVDLLFDATSFPPSNGELFVMGGGRHNRISVRAAADHLSSAERIQGPARQHEDEHVWVDTAKFDALFPKWCAKTGVIAGMDRITAWARAHADELREIYKEFAPKSILERYVELAAELREIYKEFAPKDTRPLGY